MYKIILVRSRYVLVLQKEMDPETLIFRCYNCAHDPLATVTFKDRRVSLKYV